MGWGALQTLALPLSYWSSTTLETKREAEFNYTGLPVIAAVASL